MIGKSTKSKVEGFIGEKGIGFKSVFKVADRVWIGSNGYTFKFERAERLGMVKPIWSPFPAHHLLHTTGSTLILEVIDNENDQKSNFDMIRHEIECLQGQLLMFLRRVKGLSLSIKIRDSSSTRIVKCLEHKSDGLENKLIITTSGSCTSSLAYSAYSHTLYDMPNTKLRPGVATTQIVLAFPTDLSGTRSTDGQMTYAFLPIRDYGLNVRE